MQEFNNDSLLVTSIEKAFNELQKENEDLKQSNAWKAKLN